MEYKESKSEAINNLQFPPYLSRKEGVYKVDLTRLRGEGEFPCPGCGFTISPEDETEDVYKIVETRVRKEALEELVIQCNKCKTMTRLVGFIIPGLEEYSESEEKE